MSLQVNTNLVGSVCVDDVNLFAFVTDFDNITTPTLSLITQDQAVEECSIMGLTLGPIVNEVEFQAVAQLVREDSDLFFFDTNTINHNFGFYIGLESNGPHDLNPRNFSFLPGTDPSLADGIKFYHVDNGQFPWSPGQPNSNNQQCGQLLYFRQRDNDLPGGNLDGVVSDVNCAESTGFICRGVCPIEPEGNSNNESLEFRQFFYLGGIVISALLLMTTLSVLYKIRKKSKIILSQQTVFIDI